MDKDIQDWKEELRNENFTPFDKMSGSRHLDEEKLISFIESLLLTQRKELKEKARKLPVIGFEIINTAAKGKIAINETVYLDSVLTLLEEK